MSHQRKFPRIAALYAFLRDQLSGDWHLLTIGSQFEDNCLFAKVIRHQATSSVYPGSVTLEWGEDLLLGVPLVNLDAEDFDSAKDSLLKYKPAVFEQLPDGAGLKYAFQDGDVPSFWDGPPLERIAYIPEPAVVVPTDDDVSITHLRVRSEAADFLNENNLVQGHTGFDFDGLSSRGGATLAFSSKLIAIDARGTDSAVLQLVAGISICSLNDNFCRRTGANQALARLVEVKKRITPPNVESPIGTHTGVHTKTTVEVFTPDSAVISFSLPLLLVDLRDGGQPRIPWDVLYDLAYQTLAGVGTVLADMALKSGSEQSTFREMRTSHLLSMVAVLACGGDSLTTVAGESEFPAASIASPTGSSLLEFSQDMLATRDAPTASEVPVQMPPPEPDHGTFILAL